MRAISVVCATLAVVLAVSVAAAAVSIEAEPVKVTHRNSGPRYDIEEPKRTKIEEAAGDSERAKLNASGQPTADAEAPAGEEVPAVGRVSIRRVFLFPVMRPSGDLSSQDSEERPAAPPAPFGREQEEPRVPLIFAKPFWPFMTPARPAPGADRHQEDERPHHIIRHLFGADEASRPPMANDERDQDRAPSGRDEQPQRAPFDPIQMMMDMMHQAISSQLGQSFAKDLSNSNNKDNKNKERDEAPDNSPAESSDERPLLPASSFGEPNLFSAIGSPNGAQNETREDIVEIEGRKYLRKTVVNKHVGDNIVLMTRRLIFVPLNETEPESETASTTAASPTTTLATTTTNGGDASDEKPSMPSAVHRVGANKPAEETPSVTPTTTTTTTSTTTTAAPETTSTEAATTTAPPTSTEPREETTEVPKAPSEERNSNSNKAAERLVEAPGEASSSRRSEAAEGKPASSSA